MKRGTDLDVWLSPIGRRRSVQFLVGLGFLYVLMVTIEVSFVIQSDPDAGGGGRGGADSNDLRGNGDGPRRSTLLESVEESGAAPGRLLKNPLRLGISPAEEEMRSRRSEIRVVSSLRFDGGSGSSSGGGRGGEELQKMVRVAWEVGRKVWQELELGLVNVDELGDETKAEMTRSLLTDGDVEGNEK